jgi:hypothetical protein
MVDGWKWSMQPSNNVDMCICMYKYVHNQHNRDRSYMFQKFTCWPEGKCMQKLGYGNVASDVWMLFPPNGVRPMVHGWLGLGQFSCSSVTWYSCQWSDDCWERTNFIMGCTVVHPFWWLKEHWCFHPKCMLNTNEFWNSIHQTINQF